MYRALEWLTTQRGNSLNTLCAIMLRAALGSALAFGPATVLADKNFAGFPKPWVATETAGSGETVHIAGQGTMARAMGEGRKAYVLSDLKQRKAYVIFDDGKAYYEVQRSADDGGDLADRLDPCRVQKKLAKEAPGLTCAKAGTVTLNGRKADKYVTRMQESDETLTTYFDPELRVVVKQEGGDEDEAFEMKNIKVGPPPGAFAVPAGYRKLTDKEYTARILKEHQAKGKK